jgi:hypothetical protein
VKKLLFFAGALFFAFAVACSGETEKKEEKKDSSGASCKPLNPNGDSELALLMRKMAGWNDTLRARISRNGSLTAEDLKPLPDYRMLLTAKPTDAHLDRETFAPLASLYLGQVDQFSASGQDVNQQVRNYNSMVKACVACHQNFCGGPLVRINKMFLPEKN